MSGLEKEVLDLHDEVMPHLESMKSMRRQLITEPFSSEQDSIRRCLVARELRLGDSLMWVWMYDYTAVSRLPDSMTDEQVEQYLFQKRDDIMIVNTKIKQAMSDADAILKKQE